MSLAVHILLGSYVKFYVQLRCSIHFLPWIRVVAGQGAIDVSGRMHRNTKGGITGSKMRDL